MNVIRMVLFVFQAESTIFYQRTNPIWNNDFFVNTSCRKSQVKDQQKSFLKISFV